MDELLNDLLKQYKTESTAMREACKDVDAQIANLQLLHKTLAEPYQKLLSDTEMKIQIIMNDRKESFKSEFGRITYFKAGARRSWNLDALDMVCNGNPMIKQLIWPLRHEEPFDARIQIKVD